MTRGFIKFGNTGLEFFCLGVGTLWFGRRWPMDNPSYVLPEDREIEVYLDSALEKTANREGAALLDTAAAYGLSEMRIGEYFKSHPAQFKKTFIVTKWGEEFDLEAQRSVYDHSQEALKRSVARSIERLGRIDLLLIHGTTVQVLRDESVIGEMQRMKTTRYGGLRYVGASISREDVWDQAVEQNLLGFADAIQLPADLFLKRPDLAKTLNARGKALMLNSIVRNCAKSAGKSPKQIFAELLGHEVPSMLLMGTRYHLAETIGYAGKG